MPTEKSGLKKHPKPPKDSGGGRGGKLLQHRHCQVCSKAIPISEEYCSEECKVEFEGIVKKRKNYLYIIYGIMMFLDGNSHYSTLSVHTAVVMVLIILTNPVGAHAIARASHMSGVMPKHAVVDRLKERKK